MKKVKTEMDDGLRSEYDLKSLRVRKVGPKRKRRRMMADIQKRETTDFENTGRGR